MNFQTVSPRATSTLLFSIMITFIVIPPMSYPNLFLLHKQSSLAPYPSVHLFLSLNSPSSYPNSVFLQTIIPSYLILDSIDLPALAYPWYHHVALFTPYHIPSSYLILGVGLLVSTLAFLGCCGALTTSRSLSFFSGSVQAEYCPKCCICLCLCFPWVFRALTTSRSAMWKELSWNWSLQSDPNWWWWWKCLPLPNRQCHRLSICFFISDLTISYYCETSRLVYSPMSACPLVELLKLRNQLIILS